MSRVFKQVKNSFGFTLVEMMIVVAIIGILSTLAKYGYDNYQESARQSEAKMSLPQLATSQEQFKTEYGSYTTDINAAKFIRKDVSGSWYHTGLGSGTSCAAVDNGVYGSSTTSYSFITGSTTNWMYGAACSYAQARPRMTITGSCTAATFLMGTVGPTNYALSGFTATSSGQISATKQCDMWSIDTNGSLVQRQNGK